MKIVTVIGARPQFIKAAAVSRIIRHEYAGKMEEVIVHTGQHYDENMSEVFFEDLGIPTPSYNLEISGGPHGSMTGRMLESIEKVLLKENPDWLLVYGDTNSTLAGALAAAKLHIPVAHVEAGLRSMNMRMPEEINRILTDRLSTFLFCPTETAMSNLRREGATDGVVLVGDVMFDVALFYGSRADARCGILQKLGLAEKRYALATCHRAENTNDLKRLEEICRGMAIVAESLPVVLPLHPRTRNIIRDNGLYAALGSVLIIDPLSYLDMLSLERAAKLILTDSGGVQKEAFFYGVPCITMRRETEWAETLVNGWNQLVDADAHLISQAARASWRPCPPVGRPFGEGDAAIRIADTLYSGLCKPFASTAATQAPLPKVRGGRLAPCSARNATD